MRLFYIILIALLGLACPTQLPAAPCEGDQGLVVTSPRSGAMTYYKTIAVRGFLCQNYQFVVVRNTTTEATGIADTQESCDNGNCSYTFIILMNDLAWGVNELTALVPDQDPPVEFDFEVTRTALALAN